MLAVVSETGSQEGVFFVKSKAFPRKLVFVGVLILPPPPPPPPPHTSSSSSCLVLLLLMPPPPPPPPHASYLIDDESIISFCKPTPCTFQHSQYVSSYNGCESMHFPSALVSYGTMFVSWGILQPRVKCYGIRVVLCISVQP